MDSHSHLLIIFNDFKIVGSGDEVEGLDDLACGDDKWHVDLELCEGLYTQTSSRSVSCQACMICVVKLKVIICIHFLIS